MRREERHHLKENPLATWLSEARAVVTGRGGALTTILLVAGVALVVVGIYLAWQNWRLEQAGNLLGQAMAVVDAQVVSPPEAPAPAGDETTEGGSDDAATAGGDASSEQPASVDEAGAVPFEQPPNTYPSVDAKLEAAVPKLLEAADAYPRTAPGITARYHAAAALATLGRADEAIAQYERVIELAGNDIYATMALLGLADTLISSANYERAIALLEDVIASPSTAAPIDAVLMELGRAYRQAGQSDQALASYTRVVEEFPLSAYYADAQQQVETLRQGDGARATGE